MSYSRHSIEKDDDESLVYHHESRLSRNSTGVKEEFIIPRADDPAPKKGQKDEKMLLIVFCLMVFIGLVRFICFILFNRAKEKYLDREIRFSTSS